MSSSEEKYRATMRKFAVANRSLVRHKLDAADVVYRRINKIGLTRSSIEKYMGCELCDDIAEGMK